MSIAICTLFENKYHYGVATLVNSLVHSGFEGKIYAGYRGDLPHWSGGNQLLKMGSLELVFVPLETDAHFTNYKPSFIDSLFDDHQDADKILYLDPDLVLLKPWKYVADWLTCGVCVCEDVNSPISENHPRRIGWRRYFGTRGFDLRFKCEAFVNGGLIGVSRKDRNLLTKWKRMITVMAESTGGMKVAGIAGGTEFTDTGFCECFDSVDQDALNAAIEAIDAQVSILGREAMGFKPGNVVFPHAIGRRKPWAASYLRDAARGCPPRAIDRAYWHYANGPIQAFPAARVRRQRGTLKIAAAIGRIYRRG